MQTLIICCLLIWRTIHAQSYCSVCTDHTMCRFGDKPGRTCGKSSEGGVTNSEIQTILKLHNYYRSRVAMGKETQGTPGPQPMAANMRALVWDENLAKVAQRWADQCTFRHDKCRDDPRFPVGQNIYYNSGSNVKNWTRAVELWYQEVQHVNSSHVKSYDFQGETSHYAQLAWARSRYIGCARRKYSGNYRPRDSPPFEYVLGEARNRVGDTADRTNTTGYFGADIPKMGWTAGMRGAITSKNSSGVYYAAASRADNSQQSGFFGGATSDANAAQGASSSPISGKKLTLSKPPVTYVKAPPSLSIPSISYPMYKPHYPTYSQYVAYEAANVKQIKESLEVSLDESSEESSSDESFEEKGNIIVPTSLQFKSWTSDGWQMIDYVLSTDQIYICNYGPTGNFVDEPIYIVGPPCSECPSGITGCRNGLCV